MKSKFKKGDKVVLVADNDALESFMSNGTKGEVYYIYRTQRIDGDTVAYTLKDLKGAKMNWHKEEWLVLTEPKIKCELL